MSHLLLEVLAFTNPLQPLERFLQHVLIWLHETIGFTWAWSIVALTVIVRILLVPITVRQIHSMQSLQAHAPEMKAIQQKWKHDKQRQNEELMKFYKDNKINPASASSCHVSRSWRLSRLRVTAFPTAFGRARPSRGSPAGSSSRGNQCRVR